MCRLLIVAMLAAGCVPSPVPGSPAAIRAEQAHQLTAECVRATHDVCVFFETCGAQAAACRRWAEARVR